MKTKTASAADQAAMQNENQNEMLDTAQDVQAKSSPRRRYSGNDVLRIIKALKEVVNDMERKYLSMNDIVHVLLDQLEVMMKIHKCSRAELAGIMTAAGCPVTVRTLEDYLTISRKDAREGNTHYSELKERILGQAGRRESTNCADSCAASISQEDGVSGGQEISDDSAVPGDDGWLASAISSAMAGIEAKAMARQHVRDMYEARKRRKKARKARKQK
ncbi:MAG: hypothetical protein Q3990_07525 [Desulfovibrionaceae bacterium]|nr:hypothetical protein [Desulfovibrionaceae bacterium]